MIQCVETFRRERRPITLCRAHPRYVPADFFAADFFGAAAFFAAVASVIFVRDVGFRVLAASFTAMYAAVGTLRMAF